MTRVVVGPSRTSTGERRIGSTTDARSNGRARAQSTCRLETIVKFGDHRYRYFAGSGPAGWDWLRCELSDLDADRFLIVSERSLPPDLLDEISRHVAEVGPTSTLTFPGSERAKTVSTLDTLATRALQQGATRRSCVVAVGGGLAGNVAGLLAALLFRGIRFVQIPTTLLGMSDSVLSLKQAVNSKIGKNHVGTFLTPELVWSNVDFLERLPAVERRAALCEVIKNVLAICPDDYAEVAALLNPQAELTPEQFVRVIELTIEQKSQVMASDPYEKGDALVLEYGHTVGHALEATMRGRLTHGLAIGIGMVVAAEIGRRLGVTDDELRDAHLDLLGRLDAPTLIPLSADRAELSMRIYHDNKRGYLAPVSGVRDMVLLEGPGRPVRTDGKPLMRVPEEVIEAGINDRLATRTTRIVKVRPKISAVPANPAASATSIEPERIA
jgi:3-dehydroquinate synthetase